MRDNVLYLIGGTCSGKTSLARTLESSGWTWIRSVTTRPRRPGESDEYKRWMSNVEFRYWDDHGKIADSRVYMTHDNVWYYGFFKEDLVFEQGERYVMIGDPVSARDAMFRYRTVLMLYASNDVTRERLKKRGCDDEFIRQRLSKDYDDFGKFKTIATYAGSIEGKTFAFWTAKNDNHQDRTKILNWLNERIPE
jgi:guanylate kinase